MKAGFLRSGANIVSEVLNSHIAVDADELFAHCLGGALYIIDSHLSSSVVMLMEEYCAWAF